jgi:hypothetical protein
MTILLFIQSESLGASKFGRWLFGGSNRKTNIPHYDYHILEETLMHNFFEPIIIVIVVLAVAGPIGFMRYKLLTRFIQSQESIAESLRKLVENQTKLK